MQHKRAKRHTSINGKQSVHTSISRISAHKVLGRRCCFFFDMCHLGINLPGDSIRHRDYSSHLSWSDSLFCRGTPRITYFEGYGGENSQSRRVEDLDIEWHLADVIEWHRMRC